MCLHAFVSPSSNLVLLIEDESTSAFIYHLLLIIFREKKRNYMYLYWLIWAASSDRVYPRHDLPFQSKWTTQMYFGMKTENGLQHSVTQARTQGWGSVLHPGRTQEPSKPHIILSHWVFLQNLTQFLIGISSQIQQFHTSYTNETRSYALLRTFPSFNNFCLW